MGEARLERTLGLGGAVTLNLLDMIGVGPFITLPLLLGAMGGPQAMLGWLLGAALAVCDGMVWAELGAAMPEAGGTYAYLRTIYGGRLGRLLSFLFLFQLCISAPLSVASGCLGLSQYAGFLWPVAAREGTSHIIRIGAYHAGVVITPGTGIAIATVCIAVVLLYRNLGKMRGISVGLLAVVLGTIAWAIVTGVIHGSWARVVAFPPGAFAPGRAFFLGLGSAMLIATYDYWGYYNVTFLGSEAKEPGKTIPRAVLLSIAIVFVLYLALNASVLSVLGAPALIAAKDVGARRAVLATMMEVAWGHAGAGRLAAVLVMVTAFASVFSLLLGYSRVPFAAARAGDFFAAFGRLHPRKEFPHVALLVLAAGACIGCFFSLVDVIAALVVLRIVVQFAAQHVGVMVLRARRPDMSRPFRMWLYPLPPLLALLGFAYVVVERANALRELALAGIVVVLGCVIFAARERWGRRPLQGR